jgi:hypothetical protein
MLADHRRTAPVHGATRAPGRQDTRCDQGTQVHTVTTAQRADWFVPLELDGRDARVGGVLNRVQNGLLRSYAQRPNSRTGGDTADVGKGKRNRKSRKEGSRLDAHRRRSRWRHRTGARIAAWRSRGVDAGAVAATAVPMTNAWLELPELKLRRGRWASTRVRGRRCERIAASQREQWQRRQAAEPTSGFGSLPSTFRRLVLPRIQSVSSSQLAAATGLSPGYCALVRRGDRIPAPHQLAGLQAVE